MKGRSPVSPSQKTFITHCEIRTPTFRPGWSALIWDESPLSSPPFVFVQFTVKSLTKSLLVVYFGLLFLTRSYERPCHSSRIFRGKREKKRCLSRGLWWYDGKSLARWEAKHDVLFVHLLSHPIWKRGPRAEGGKCARDAQWKMMLWISKKWLLLKMLNMVVLHVKVMNLSKKWSDDPFIPLWDCEGAQKMRFSQLANQESWQY